MVNFETLLGMSYGCESDLRELNAKKTALDFHTLNIGNTKKSTLTPSQLKLIEIEYETLKKKYENSACGKDPIRNKCLELKSGIENSRSTINYFYNIKDFDSGNKTKITLENQIKEFDNTKCISKIADFKAENIKSIQDVYSGMDKKRIEEESKYQAKQRIFFGVIVFVGVVVMVTIFGKKQ